MPRQDDPRLEDVSSASLCDAMDEMFGHEAHIKDIVSPTPDRILYGPASTIRFVPVREDKVDEDVHNSARLFYEAVPEPRARQVLVLDTSGNYDLAPVGATKAHRLAHHGLAGMIADCRFRDYQEIAELPISAWCRGDSPKAGSHKLMPVGANVPANVGDVTITPGDQIYADRGGAVVLPHEHVDDLLDRAVEIEVEDDQRVQAIKNEDPDEILGRADTE